MENAECNGKCAVYGVSELLNVDSFAQTEFLVLKYCARMHIKNTIIAPKCIHNKGKKIEEIFLKNKN